MKKKWLFSDIFHMPAKSRRMAPKKFFIPRNLKNLNPSSDFKMSLFKTFSQLSSAIQAKTDQPWGANIFILALLKYFQSILQPIPEKKFQSNSSANTWEKISKYFYQQYRNQKVFAFSMKKNLLRFLQQDVRVLKSHAFWVRNIVHLL